MVSAGTDYTVASLGSAAGRRLQVLPDQIAAPNGEALVRVIQASSKQPQVTVSIGADTLARQLAFGSVTTYQAVQPGTPTVAFSTPDGHAAMPVTLAAGSVHTIVVLDGTSGLKIENLTDAAASQVAAKGGAATGLGGTAPGPAAPAWRRGWPPWPAVCCWPSPEGSACAGHAAAAPRLALRPPAMACWSSPCQRRPQRTSG